MIQNGEKEKEEKQLGKDRLWRERHKGKIKLRVIISKEKVLLTDRVMSKRKREKKQN